MRSLRIFKDATDAYWAICPAMRANGEMGEFYVWSRFNIVPALRNSKPTDEEAREMMPHFWREELSAAGGKPVEA